jgi:Chaperone of endosialidase
MRTLVFLFLSLVCISTAHAQSFAINTDGSTANTSALLDVKSTTKGLLIPRLTKAQKYAVTTPAVGLLIYQTGPDSSGFYYYQNSQWNWITDNKKSDSAYWSQYGNANTNPPPNFPFGVNGYTYLGTPDAKDVSLVAGGNELLRLKQIFLGGRIGMSNQNPEYALDIRTTENTVSTAINGMRIIPKELYDFNSNNNMDKGFIIGNDPVTPTENIIWNHSSNTNGVIRMGVSYYDQFVRPAININQYGQGIYQKNPKYLLDIHSNSNFAGTTPYTIKNGVRITYPNQEILNTEEKGLFMGVGVNANSFKSYIWNYTDGPSANTPDRAIYFGVGGDLDYSSNRATMELQNGKITMGSIIDPNYFFPSTLNIQTSLAASAAKNGISIMQHMTNNESAYFGTDAGNNLNIFKYGTGDILLGTNGTDQVIIKPTGNIGIGETSPGFPLNFTSTLGDKISLYGNLGSHYGFGIQGSLLQIHSAGNGDDIAFGYGSSGSFTERMRIKGNGAVGIGINNPSYVLEVNGRGLVHSGGSNSTTAGIWFNNNANTINTGFVGMESDNAIGFYGTGTPNGWGLLMNIASGNVGIGTSNPSQKLHVIGNILATGTITPSDSRYKKNIQPLKNALHKVQQLNAVTYIMNQQAFPEWQFDNLLQYGLIAQEVEKVFPEMVKTIDNKGYKGVDYVKLIPVLIEAIKDQQKQIDELKILIKNK